MVARWPCCPKRSTCWPAVGRASRRAVRPPPRLALAVRAAQRADRSRGRALALRYSTCRSSGAARSNSRPRAHPRAAARIRPHFLFNSMKHDRGAHALEPGAGRASDRGPVRPVPCQPERRARADHAEEEVEIARTYQRNREAAARRTAAGAWDVDDLPPRCLMPACCCNRCSKMPSGTASNPLPQGGIVDVRAGSAMARSCSK